MKLGLGVGVALFVTVVGGVIGFRISNWWLYRTIKSPELETAIYPVMGTLIGATFALILMLVLAWHMSRTKRDQ